MADSLCGPSNGAKNLVSHTERDRSLHQDRHVNTSTVFNQGINNGAVPSDGAFEAFQNGVPAHVTAIQSAGPAIFPTGHGVHPSAAQLAMPLTPSMPHHAYGLDNVGPIHPAYMGHVQQATPGSWVNEFTRMNVNESAQGLPPATVYQAPVNNIHSQTFRAMPGQSFMHPGFMQMPQGSLHNAPSTVSEDISQADTVAQEQDQAFSAAFGAFDEDDFQRELNQWLAVHGEPDQPMGAAVREIDRNLEFLAQELESRRRAGDPAVLPTNAAARAIEEKRIQNEELVKAAASILDTVSGNRSEKFKNSIFMETMRRIANHEVIAENNDLVDAKTGKSVVTTNGEDGADRKPMVESKDEAAAQNVSNAGASSR